MPIEIITLLISAGTGAISGLAGYFAGTRQRSAVARGSELGNVEKAVTIWQGLAEELRQEVAVMKVEMSKIHEENQSLRLELASLRSKMQAHLDNGCNIF